jgi:hypothetical protein
MGQQTRWSYFRSPTCTRGRESHKPSSRKILEVVKAMRAAHFARNLIHSIKSLINAPGNKISVQFGIIVFHGLVTVKIIKVRPFEIAYTKK